MVQDSHTRKNHDKILAHFSHKKQNKLKAV